MPSTLSSSFASAAAGNHNDSRGAGRGEGGGFNDWARRTNGATQTFRRPSLATNPSSSNIAQRETSVSSMVANPPTPGPGAYVPPHITASRNGSANDLRYTREQLLELFRQQRDAGELNSHLSDLYIGEGDALVNGASTAKWGRRDETDDMAENICWDKQGSILPLGLVDMTEDEREIFTSSVNSPLKAPNPTSSKEGANHREGTAPRKSSISHVQNSSALPSPLGTRTGSRRRETSESYPFPNSGNVAPAGGKGLRDDGSTATTPSLLRRRTDIVDSPTEISQDKDRSEKPPGAGTAFGAIKRASSGAFGPGLGGPSSPWGAAAQSLPSPGGAFSSFLNSETGLGSPAVDKRPGFGRGESRFKTLMVKEAGGNEAGAIVEEPSEGNGAEHGSSQSRNDSLERISGTDALGDESVPIGSAALGGAHDDSPPFATPNRARFNGDQNFNAYNSGNAGHEYEEFEDRRGFNQYQNHAYAAQQDNTSGGAESLSPTFTNPYQSPEQPISNLNALDNDEPDALNFHLPGLGGFKGDMSSESHSMPFSGHQTLPRNSSGFEHRPFERQPSSSALNRGFPTLGGLGGLGGLGTPGQWPPAPAIGTPLRERPSLLDTFAEPSVRSPGGLHSPAIGLGGLGGLGAPGGATGTIGRSSRLGTLFSPAMQEHMRPGHGQAPKHDGASERGEENVPFGMHGLGNNLPDGSNADAESQYRAGRGKFDDFFTGDDGQTNRSMEQSDFANEGVFGQGQAYSPAQQSFGAPGSQIPFGHAQQQTPFSQLGQRAQPSIGSSASNQPPPAQQKTMVMPDRIRWIYRDPQGNTQGPWSGLEMHDWYRAGFFSPELLVKKQEDADYEPLAQLIRRIGNSREPFLVPQIGIPGPPNAQVGASWPAPSAAPTVPTSASVAQPPFASSFPSFGTTLTAEQQNALERRKQEEQYLMARQKEHLAQQQVLVKQMQMQGQHGGLSQQLHHQASAHSLHSQPSFGSLTSPGGYANTMQNLPVHFDNNGFRLGAVGAIGSGLEKLGHIREEESPFQRLNRGPSFQGLFTGAAPHDPVAHDQRTQAMFADRARLQQEQADAEADAHHRDQEESRIAIDRYQQFQDMRSSMEEESRSQSIESHTEEFDASQQQQSSPPETVKAGAKQEVAPEAKHNLSLTEQVQQAASAKQSPAPTQSPWAKIDTSIPEPFPPPQSSSPLPAPAARRNRSHVADALAAESSSARASPSVETPSSSLAPWARETSDAPNKPSLREIQEAEGRRAAKQEEIASAARRAALEREIATLATQAAAPAPGLPSSSNWATVESPATPASAASAWTKPAVGKVTAGGSATKKTLQQIQKEEEALARKQRAAAIAVSNATVASAVAGAAQALSSGKRYADLASKAAAAVPPASTGAWTTVGASGKVKAPVALVPVTGLRSTSSPAPPAVAAAAARPKPTPAPVRPATTTSAPNALAEFNKWAVHELAHDLNKGIQVDDFVGGLMNFPSDIDVITEAVHSVSQTMDSRHFAEEYVRRRALAEKGKIVEMANAASSHHAASESKGWSEVARKGPINAAKAQEESNAFKIVPAKKKGKK